MRVIIAGPRTAFSEKAVCHAMELAKVHMGIWPAVLVSGQAVGIDTAACSVCHTLGVPIEPHPITDEHRARYGLRAGMERNSQMEQAADALIAVWDGHSPGTWDMIHKMVCAAKPVFLGMLKNHQNKNDLHMWKRRARSGLFLSMPLDYEG